MKLKAEVRSGAKQSAGLGFKEKKLGNNTATQRPNRLLPKTEYTST